MARHRKGRPPTGRPVYAIEPNRFYLKSLGRRSSRLHFSHSATFLIFPFSKRVFILTSPPQEQKNFCVELDVRLFLLAAAIIPSPCPARIHGKHTNPAKDHKLGIKYNGRFLPVNTETPHRDTTERHRPCAIGSFSYIVLLTIDIGV